jgi:hypothetical protein
MDSSDKAGVQVPDSELSFAPFRQLGFLVGMAWPAKTGGCSFARRTYPNST